MDDNFRQQIIAQIEASGVPLEIETVQRLRARNWLAVPNLHFQDSASSIHEMDVYGGFIRTDEGTHPYFPPGIELVIECKRSLRKPWIFFEDNVEIVFAKDIFHKLRILADLPAMRHWPVSVARTGEIVANHHYGNDSIPRAHTYLETFRSHDAPSEIFSAIRSVWYAEDCARRWFYRLSESGDKRKRVNLLHGAVVIDGALLTAKLSESDDWNIEEVDHVMVRTVDAMTRPTASPLTEDNEVVVDVIRCSYFSEYLRICEADLEAFCEYLRPRE